ncbi:uncharacterized protein BDZ99DRAFT_500954 [Mytilinidion resinicola]|uniref:Uncharacterized protein n=1 Tax=Mytilinidion resinicola TaxID=574789 RepID=A0A6A6YEA2_9PEZI|nr:uncharacterized protein BDZ99DRAFT_500954 [Mytilinidion resinicola]KAF2806929.1 hypothetical protein BDZ99DRAFT_500954 [Mytilinidion resinicola]
MADVTGYTIKRVGLREFATTGDGVAHYSRRIGGAWEPYQAQAVATVATERSPLSLFVVRQDQSEGESLHWCLVVGREGENHGNVYQVKGDATGMRYVFANHVNIFGSNSFRNSYRIASLDSTSASRVYDCAILEPPRAANQAAVTENC